MNIESYFDKQKEAGATEMFFYDLERPDPHTVSIMSHKGTLDSFPTNLEYIRHMSEGMPLFKEIQ